MNLLSFCPRPVVAIDDLLTPVARDTAGLASCGVSTPSTRRALAEPAPPAPTGLRVPATGMARCRPAMG